MQSRVRRATRVFARAACLRLIPLLLGVLPFVAQDARAADGSLSKEYQIKAAFLYNFTKFIEWPAQSFNSLEDPIVVGVYCAEPFATELWKIVEERKVNGRALVVKRLETARDAGAGHLLFVCSAQDALLSEIQSEVQSRPVVTVGESEYAARRGAVIRFVLEDDKVRFEINMAAADRAGVKISAQLQKLATTVTRAPQRE